MMTAGEIRELRRSMELTQYQFAERLGVSQMTVARWEIGVCSPSPLAMMRLEDLKNGRKEI